VTKEDRTKNHLEMATLNRE